MIGFRLLGGCHWFNMSTKGEPDPFSVGDQAFQNGARNRVQVVQVND